MANKRILVIGGTGYIGRVLVKELVKEFDVTLMLRKSPNYRTDYKYFICDLLNKECLIKNIKHFDIVIDLASIIKTIHKKRYEENIIGLKNLIEVLEKNKINKLVYFSTQNVNLANKGYYAKSKKNAEEIIKKSNLDYMIIRPNYVYEVGKKNYFYKIFSLISKFNIVIIIGNGDKKIQPVLREDLAAIVLKLIRDFKKKSIFEVSGKDTLSINQIVDLISKSLKRNPIKIHLPIKILKIFSLIIPFDIVGFDEDRVSIKPYKKYNFLPFDKGLKEISSLLKNK